MSSKWKRIFRLILGITGSCETLLGLSIVFFATYLQRYLATGVLSEPLYFRILGMMDFYIGLCYVVIALHPDRYLILNKGTCLMRLGLSCLFLAEGVWLLEEKGLRLIYQFFALFDFSLFVIQGLYIKSAMRQHTESGN
jgi:hypothetical protein